MGSTGSVSSWDEALLIAAIQYPVPVIKGPEDIQIQVDKICRPLTPPKPDIRDLMLSSSRNIQPRD